jgi:phosphotriesterase-related protein
MKRREFMCAAAMSLADLAVNAGPAAQLRRVVMTVRGPVDAAKIGVTLMHEHVLVDFVGADKVSRDRYDADEAFAVALPHLRRAAELGCRTFVDCTPAYIGRDAALLRRLSEAAKLNVVTTTGYYGAANDKFVPAFAYRESAEDLAARWVAEFERGIEGTGVRPGIIKIGVDAGPLSEIDAKLVRAAALTHLKTGLTIASHTGDGAAALAQLDLITGLGVSPTAFIWVHAQNEKDRAVHERAAARGCWVEFDGVSSRSAAEHVTLVTHLAEGGFLNRILVSMDAGWYHVGEPRGGNYRGYESLFTEFMPALRSKLGGEQVRRLLTANPQDALSIGVRRLGAQ